MPKGSFSDNEQILNYDDAVIYGSDLKLVNSRTEWLNDACIHFYMNVLRNRLNQSPRSNTEFLFMDPSVVSFFMHQCSDEEDFEDFKKGTKLPNHGFVFIPVNNAMRRRSEFHKDYFHNGSHWSLLVIAICKSGSGTGIERHRQYWHFDSVKHSGNSFAAKDIADKLSAVFPHGSETIVQEADAPQQENGYDCGIHMLETMKLLCSDDMSNEKCMDKALTDLQLQENKLQIFVKANPGFCQRLRKEIVQEILDHA